MILNADDYLMHDALEVTLALFASYPEVALMGARAIHFDSDRFDSDRELEAAPKTIRAYAGANGLSLVVHEPADVRTYRT